MAAYRLANGGVIREADGAFIPSDPLNSDWQIYQVWLAQGRTPDPAPAVTPAQIAATAFNAALAAGLTVNWTTSTALNGTYGVSQIDQFNITAETVSILTNNTFTNGQATRGWPTIAGVYATFTVAQFKAFATAAALYVDELQSAYATASAGQPTTWPPAITTINL